MIAPLRRRHRTISLALTAALPVVVIASVAARPRWAVTQVLEREPGSARFTFEASAPFQGGPARLCRGVLATGGEAITVEAPRGWNVADGLLYTVDDDVVVGGALPAGAVLLGALAGPPPWEFALPPEARRAYCVVYSLARQEVAGSAPLPEVD